MAHKNGRKDVWLNIGVLTKILSISIEYETEKTEERSNLQLSLGTKFTRGQFASSEINSFAGQHFTATNEEIKGSDLQSKILSDYTIKYDFDDTFRDIEALYIKDDFYDFVSLTVTFTDYDPTWIDVYPKMSQPGRCSRPNELLIFDQLCYDLLYT